MKYSCTSVTSMYALSSLGPYQNNSCQHKPQKNRDTSGATSMGKFLPRMVVILEKKEYLLYATGATSAASNAARRKGHSIAFIVLRNSESSFSSVAAEVSRQAMEAPSGVISAHVKLFDSLSLIDEVMSSKRATGVCECVTCPPRS